DAMGLGLHFIEGEGPRFKNPLRDEASIMALAVPDPMQELRYVMDAVSTIRRELNGRVPLIGFSGSPWTLATYMVEGGSSKDFKTIKAMMFERPELVDHLLDTIAQSVTLYLNAQIESGAQTVMIFDTWGGALTPSDYERFSLNPMRKIIQSLTREQDGQKVPVIMFTKNGGQWLEIMADTGADALGLDWTTNLADARRRVGDRVALQGNLDPSVLYASPEVIRKQVGKVLASFGKGDGHVFNLGHGIHPGIDPEHAGAMINAVHELSQQYHS
ncbi:MAG: uroporphyrinogen decarboxylase, partial [Gammaproteobacteria bacterium]